MSSTIFGRNIKKLRIRPFSSDFSRRFSLVFGSPRLLIFVFAHLYDFSLKTTCGLCKFRARWLYVKFIVKPMILQKIRERAAADLQHIILPEGEDIRTVYSPAICASERVA